MTFYQLIYGLGTDPSPAVIKRSFEKSTLETLMQELKSDKTNTYHDEDGKLIGWFDIETEEIE